MEKDLKAFIAISGNLLQLDHVANLKRVLAQIRRLTVIYNTVVIGIGGGTQINQALLDHGIQPEQHGKLGRKVTTDQIRYIMLDVLNENKHRIRQVLKEWNIRAVVDIPRHHIGGVLCHVNKDIMVLNAYHGFDLIVVFTESEKKTEKQQWFNQWEEGYEKKKIIVLGFEEPVPL